MVTNLNDDNIDKYQTYKKGDTSIRRNIITAIAVVEYQKAKTNSKNICHLCSHLPILYLLGGGVNFDRLLNVEESN